MGRGAGRLRREPHRRLHRRGHGDELTDDDGREIDLGQFGRISATGHERLAVGCRAPELVDELDQDVSEDPPPGRLAFYRQPASEEGEQESGGKVVVANVDGTDEQELEVADRTDDPAPGARPASWRPCRAQILISP
jgi:hypothetical protein